VTTGTTPAAAGHEPTDAPDLPEQLQVRREKYDRLLDDGRYPFPVHVHRTHDVAAVRAAHPDLPADTHTGDVVGVAGRVMFIRNTGKLAFAALRDGEAEIQLMLSLGEVGEESLAAWKADVDLGDLVWAHGEVITSKRGELSVLVDRWELAAKALRPLPVAHKELSEDTRMRQRYVDLIMSPDARAMVRTRATVLHALRDTLDRRDYVELETPILQTVHGGAAARPFRTHVNAFDSEVTLRIATELFLKRAIVGGIPRVYEIGKTFRNEGIDSTHSAEFTMLEAYESYGDYDTMATLTRDLVVDAAHALGLSEVLAYSASGPVPIDIAGQWRHATVFELVSEALGEAVDIDTDVETLRRHAAARGVELQPGWDAGEITLELYEKLVERTLLQPTFVRDYPVSVRPLARRHRDDPRLAEAWDLVVGGVELAPAYSELNDPVDQRRRLVQQSLAAAAGDPEAMELDEDFLRALEYGMPPTGGMGMGVDRLIMVLTGRGIRETILFPMVRPEAPRH
jgi:lysyl-tRNA synthetase, class II